MEKVHVKACFSVFVPFECQEGLAVTPDEATKPNLRFTLGEKQSEALIFNIRVFVKNRLSSKIEYEQSDCLTWKKRSPLGIKKPTDSDNGQQQGLILRIKINQGAFDLRNTKRFVRLGIECTNPVGQLLHQATSQFFQALPRKRKSDVLSQQKKKDGEVIIQMQWQHLNDLSNSNSVPMNVEPSNTNTLSAPILDERDLIELFAGQGELSTASNDELNASQSGNLAVSDSPSQLQVYSDDSPEHIQPASISYEGAEHDNYMVLYNGNAEVIGNFRALNFYKASDINIKEDVRLLMEDHDPRDVILKIDGVTYKFKSSVSHATNKRFVGYIAQQIESVVPEAVQLIDGILHVDYESLIPYLSESIKQNFNDIKNISSEQERIKLIVDMLYDDFLKRERAAKHPQRASVVVTASDVAPAKQHRARGAWRRVVGAVIGAVLIMSAVMFGAYMLIEQKTHEDNNNNNTAPQQIVVPAHNLDTDRRVLEDLFIATNGGSWSYALDTKAVRWMTEEPMCKWYGVVCAKGRVTALLLTVMNMSGTIPESIGDLDALQNLNFAINNLSGTIPSSIRNLKNLNQLWLNLNPRLSGTIPDLPTDMFHIWLHYCNFTGPIPASIVNWTSAYEVRLDTNQLTGSFPQLPLSGHVTVFNASHNRLEGSLPVFAPGTAVGTLDVSYNRLSGTIENLSTLAVATVVLNDNQFSGEVAHLNFTSVLSFTFTNNHFTSFNSSVPRPKRKKIYCDASNNPFKCPIPDWVSQSCKASCT